MNKYLAQMAFGTLLLTLLLSAVPDNGLLATLLGRIEKLNHERPQEKVHIHFDKSYYSIGDDIWFKAYVVNAEHNQLSTLSKVLYIDLIDEQDSIRSTTVYALEHGLAYGAINLSDSLFLTGTIIFGLIRAGC